VRHGRGRRGGQHRGGVGVPARPLLAGGAARPARGPGSSAEPAPAAAQGGRARSALAAGQGLGGGGVRPFRPGRRRRRR